MRCLHRFSKWEIDDTLDFWNRPTQKRCCSKCDRVELRSLGARKGISGLTMDFESQEQADKTIQTIRERKQ